MAKIRLLEGGFTLIPEGTTTFKIVGVEYKEDFGKMSVEMQTKSGLKHTERFSLLKNNGEVNEGALKAFSYFAKTALNNYQLDEIDESDIVGCYITATVKHEEYSYEKDGETKSGKSARLNDYAVAVGFDNSKAEDVSEDSSDDDLDDFLND
jgi:hypothetical protein